MKIQEITRRLIIDELIMHGCITGQMSVSDFVQRVYPKAREMPTTDWRFGMKTAIDDIHQHMDNNNDWEFEHLFCSYLDLLTVERTVRYFRENSMVRIKYNSLADLNSQAHAWCNKINA